MTLRDSWRLKLPATRLIYLQFVLNNSSVSYHWLFVTSIHLLPVDFLHIGHWHGKRFISKPCIRADFTDCDYLRLGHHGWITTKVGDSSSPQVETFSLSKTLTLSKEHPFLCRKCINFTSKISIQRGPVFKNTWQQMSGPENSIG